MDLTVTRDGSLTVSAAAGLNLPSNPFPGTADWRDINVPFGLAWRGAVMVCMFECYISEIGGSSFELMTEQMIEPRELPARVLLAEGVLMVLGGKDGKDMSNWASLCRLTLFIDLQTVKKINT